MGLGAPDNNSAADAPDPAEIEVRVRLLGGTQAAVAFGVRHRDGDAQVLPLEVISESLQPLRVGCSVSRVAVRRKDGQGIDGIRSALFRERRKSKANPAADFGQFPPIQQILRRARGQKKAAVGLAIRAARHGEIAPLRGLGQFVVYRR